MANISTLSLEDQALTRYFTVVPENWAGIVARQMSVILPVSVAVQTWVARMTCVVLDPFPREATGLEPSVVGMGASAVARPTAVYALVTVMAELARRASRRRGVRLVQLVVLLDGVYLAAVMAPIGGSHSVLVFLVYLHLIAVTLLISHRAGLKLAVW